MGKTELNIKESVHSEENSKRFTNQQNQKHSQMLLDLVKEETKKVKGIFRIFGADGNPMEGAWDKVTFRKFPEDLCPPFEQLMQDGQTYEVPLYIARFLNGYDGAAKARNGKINSCSYGIHAWKTSQHGAPVKNAMSEMAGVTPVELSEPTRYKRTYGFESVLIGDIA